MIGVSMIVESREGTSWGVRWLVRRRGGEGLSRGVGRGGRMGGEVKRGWRRRLLRKLGEGVEGSW